MVSYAPVPSTNAIVGCSSSSEMHATHNRPWCRMRAGGVRWPPLCFEMVLANNRDDVTHHNASHTSIELAQRCDPTHTKSVQCFRQNLPLRQRCPKRGECHCITTTLQNGLQMIAVMPERPPAPPLLNDLTHCKNNFSSNSTRSERTSRTASDNLPRGRGAVDHARPESSPLCPAPNERLPVLVRQLSQLHQPECSVGPATQLILVFSPPTSCCKLCLKM